MTTGSIAPPVTFRVTAPGSTTDGTTDDTNTNTYTGDPVAGTISVSGGSWQSEVSWSLSCDDGFVLSGNNPYDASGATTHSITGGALCTLTMLDSYGDGWNGAMWVGLVRSVAVCA